MANPSIGVFDSGIGGKLIAQKIRQALPQPKVVFKSDPQFFPYGPKSPKVILDRVAYFAKQFQLEGCKLMVIACNSATTNVISLLRRQFPKIIFIGVEPPIKPAAKLTKTGKVAIMGTPATIKSQRHLQLKNLHGKGLTIYEIACEGLAEIIETDPTPRPATAKLLHRFLDQPVAEGVDAVGLACTHYPYLIAQMRQLYPQVTFYDPSDAVVKQVQVVVNKLREV